MTGETEIVLVRFVMANAPYMAGETAGFPPGIAKKFVARKRAVFVGQPGETDAPPTAEDAPKPKAKAKAKAKAKK